jgi:ubiquinone/menaquinone biosynthesis C-methylase UbiE
MKKINDVNLNTVQYWDEHIATPDYGLRQERYFQLAGEGKKILEVGCGSSPFLCVATANFDECWGLDFSPKTLKKCRKLYPTVNYVLGNAMDTPFKDKFFDVVVAGELIEHLEKPEVLIKEMARVGKTLIFSTARMEYDEPEHLWRFEKEDFIKMLVPYGEVYVEEIESELFKGRSYLFAKVCQKSSKHA